MAPFFGQDKGPEPAKAPSRQASRQAVPSSAAQKDYERLLREVFKDEYNKVTPPEIKALALMLLDKADDEKNDATIYVMLRDAKDLAASISDITIAFRATDRISEKFEVDDLAMKMSVLETAARRLSTPESARSIAEAYLSLIDVAVRQENVDSAKACLSKADALAKSSKLVPVLSQNSAACSCGLPGVETQEAAQPISAANRAG